MIGSEEHRQHTFEPWGQLDSTPASASWLDAMARYGSSKLLLSAAAHELSRRWAADKLTVYDVCPGPVASDIARDTPLLVAWAVAAVLHMMLPSAAEAALPVVALAVDPAFAFGRGAPVHHHMSEARAAGGNAIDEAFGAWVLAQSLDISLRSLLAFGPHPADLSEKRQLEMQLVGQPAFLLFIVHQKGTLCTRLPVVVMHAKPAQWMSLCASSRRGRASAQARRP
mmetsp:Transcript_21336/g.49802  ORF Transcript_21336/g.49802 Transcript_21336/m.49802 type:complete len:226 (+) Transcript_21336:883-1560(+)